METQPVVFVGTHIGVVYSILARRQRLVWCDLPLAALATSAVPLRAAAR